MLDIKSLIINKNSNICKNNYQKKKLKKKINEKNGKNKQRKNESINFK